MSRTVQLPPTFDGFVDRMVESGRYGSPDDLFADALSLLESMEQHTDALNANYKVQIAEGLAAIEAGRTHDVDEVFAELDEIIRRHEERRDAAE